MAHLRTLGPALLLSALLGLGVAACSDQAPEGTGADAGVPEDGTDTGEGAPPEGGLGEDVESDADYS